MSKQIIYPKFISRLFSATLDMFLIALIISHILHFASQYVFVYIFKDLFAAHNIDTSNMSEAIKAATTPEFVRGMSSDKFWTCLIISFAMNISALAAYFISFWYKIGYTPGKFLIKMKIVDANDYNKKPSLKMCIYRFLAYITIPIGWIFVIFDKERRAIHDKIAGTTVISS